MDCRPNKKRVFLICVLWSILLFAVLYKTIGLYYAINDDITLHNISSGLYMEKPESHLAGFIYYVYGAALAALYTAFPAVDWYGGALVGLEFVCYVLMLYTVFSRAQTKRPGLREALLAVLCTAILLGTVILFQFTVVSGMLLGTALFLLVCLDTKGKKSLWSYSLILVLLLIGCMLRKKAFYMVAPLFVLVWAGKLFVFNRAEGETRSAADLLKNRKTLGFALCTLAFLLLYGGMNRIESKVYDSEPWKTYWSYNHSRSLIMDYYDWPEYEGNEAFWEQEGFSVEKQKCLTMYGILPDVDAEVIGDIAQYAASLYKEESLYRHVRSMGALLLEVLTYESVLPYYGMLAVLIVALIRRLAAIRDRRAVWYYIAVAGVMAMYLFYLLWGGRLPARVALLLVLQAIFIVMGGLLCLPSNTSEKASVPASVLKAVLCCGILAFIMNTTVGQVGVYRESLEEYAELMDYMDNSGYDLFIASAGTVKTVKQFSFRDDKYEDKWFGSYGWSSNSPWYRARYQKLGVPDGVTPLLHEGAVFFTKDIEKADNLNAYFKSENIVSDDYQIVDRLQIGENALVFVKW